MKNILEREVFYPFTKIIQVVFDDLLPKAIPKDPEEKENMHEKSIVKNEDFFLKKSNISKFMCQMNSDNFSYFFKMGDNIEILLDVPMASIQQNEKQMLENEEIKSIMLNNTLSTIRETTRDLKLYSLAGQVRKESAIFFDAEKYEIPFKEKQPITVIFAHSNYKEICVKFFQKFNFNN